MPQIKKATGQLVMVPKQVGRFVRHSSALCSSDFIVWSTVYTIKVLWATCTGKRWKMHKHLVNMSIFRVKTYSFFFSLVWYIPRYFLDFALYSAILRYHFPNCIRKYKCGYIVYILPVLVYYFVPKAFLFYFYFFFYFDLLKYVKYKALSEYSTLIG